MARETEPDRVVGGRYRLVAELGSGGFGRVWRARDEALGVEVAVKEVWLPESAAEAERTERLKRAEREARNAAQLRDHPNVVAVHDVFIESGSPWIVMRLVDGMSLQDAIDANGRVPVEKVRQVAIGVLRALGAARQAGITHRDVKPANVLLAAGGEVLLTDFGIAVHEADTALTATGRVIGTVEYTAPERLRGGDDHGTTSDLFSLGATLYAAVEGRSPFHRPTTAASMAAVLFDQPTPPQYAGDLTDLITGLLTKDPARRPTVDDALTLTERTPKPPPRTRPFTMNETVSEQTPDDVPKYRRERVLKEPYASRVFAVAFNPDGNLLATGRDDGKVRLWDPTTGRPIGELLSGLSHLVGAVAFSPDGSLLAGGGAGGTLRLWNPATGRAIDLRGHTDWVSAVAFSPDGRLLATGGGFRDGTVRLWDPATGRAVGSPFTGHAGFVAAVAFSPDGRLLASGGGDDGTVQLWDPVTGQSVSVLQGHTDLVRGLAFSPDGNLLASGSDDGTVRLWDPLTGRAIGRPLAGHTDFIRGVAFSPDSNLLASGGDGGKGGTVRLWDPATGAPVGHPLTGHTQRVMAVAFSPDSRLLASAGGGDGTVRLWRRRPPS